MIKRILVDGVVREFQPGVEQWIGGKRYILCGDCGGIVRIKPIFGALHVCDDPKDGT
jgi:hypothetical protein